MLTVEQYDEINRSISMNNVVGIIYNLDNKQLHIVNKYLVKRCLFTQGKIYTGEVMSSSVDRDYNYVLYTYKKDTLVNQCYYLLYDFKIVVTGCVVITLIDEPREYNDVDKVITLLFCIINSTLLPYTNEYKKQIQQWLMDRKLNLTIVHYSNNPDTYRNITLSHAVKGEHKLLCFYNGVFMTSLDYTEINLISIYNNKLLEGSVIQGVYIPKELRNSGAPRTPIWFIPYDSLIQAYKLTYSDNISSLPHVLRLNYAYEVEQISNKTYKDIMTINMVSFKSIDNVEEFYSFYRQLMRSKDLMSYKVDGIMSSPIDNKKIFLVLNNLPEPDNFELMQRYHMNVLQSILRDYPGIEMYKDKPDSKYVLVVSDKYWSNRETFEEFIQDLRRYEVVVYYGLDGDLITQTFKPINGPHIDSLKLGKYMLTYSNNKLKINDEEHYLTHLDDMRIKLNKEVTYMRLDNHNLTAKERILSRMYTIAILK